MKEKPLILNSFHFILQLKEKNKIELNDIAYVIKIWGKIAR